MIDSVYCLCVDKRKDEFWPVLERDCKLCTGLELTKFIAGSQNDPTLVYNHYDIPYHSDMNRYVGYTTPATLGINFNIFVCHKKIFAQAMNNNETILLMEDDAQFLVNRWDKVWNSSIVQDFLIKNNWDALFLGYWQRLYEGDKVYGETGERNWKENSTISIKRALSNVPARISGMHGVILNKSFLKTIYDECKISPMDSFINNNLDRFHIYYLEPQLIGCRSNFSFCENSFIEREELI